MGLARCMLRQSFKRAASHVEGRSLSSILRHTSSFTVPSARRNLHHGTTTLQIHPVVQKALAQHRPVVALESTILAHGMPYPENYQLSQKLSDIFKQHHVQPATIAVRNGVCCVGLEQDDIHDLCLASKEGRALKCSTRDLPIVMANARLLQQPQENAPISWGATTVASTMHLAHLAGIRTFCTGGIGGVHRNAESSMDVSADLVELSRTPLIVVSAGIKSILDISRTLQVLETYGVLTLAYRTDEFPAFFSPHSHVKAPARVDTPEQVAHMYWAARDLQLSHGIMLAVPNHDPAGASVELAIQAALREAHDENVTGQAVTPFILKRVAEATGGESLRSNVALVQENARVSAQIAIAVCEQGALRKRKTIYSSSEISKDTDTLQPSRVIVMGGCVFDLLCKPLPNNELLLHTSNPASVIEVDGGVGRNIAEVLGRLNEAPIFYSSIGNDSRGQGMLQRLESMKVQVNETSMHVCKHQATATYVASFDGTGDLHVGYADMAALEQIQVPSNDVLKQAKMLVMDANPPIHILQQAAQRAVELGVEVFWEPTSVHKAYDVACNVEFMSHLTAAFPNASELVAMAQACNTSAATSLEQLQLDINASSWNEASMETLEQAAATVLANMNQNKAYLVVTLGSRGVLLATRRNGNSETATSPEYIHFPAVDANLKIVNASGAGDSLCGAFVYAILEGHSSSRAVEVGMAAARLSLECNNQTVSPRLSKETLGL
ncbi:hypothetical protein MPSEU_000863500 [Mayamaea pseudoterrestris]|nr:hypothetical protein MPSEU_000863500 [Mayamaea pseudoterrestris]